MQANIQDKAKIIVYGHSTCPQVPAVKMLLNHNKINYEYINIHSDEEARNRVKTINHGNESVPTLEFDDGSTLTEPALGEIRRKLESQGYEVHISLMSRLAESWGIILLVVALIFALLRGLGVF